MSNEIMIKEVDLTLQKMEATSDLVNKAKSYVVNTSDSYKEAGEFLKSVKALQKEVIETFKESKDLAFKTHKSITQKESTHLTPLNNAEDIVKKKMLDFQLSENKRIQDEQRIAQDKERQRRVEEQKRLADEQKAREDEALKQAEALKASGDHAAAEAVVNEVATETKIEPMQESIPVQVEKAPSVKGTSVVTTWAFEMIDPSKVNRAFLMVDESKIKKTVKAMGKDAESLIGGIKVFQESSMRARA